MESSVLTVVSDYGGILVGAVLLLLAVSVLPGRIKWYVLTAGLAVLGYEAYMRSVNRKLLKEADAERERLRGELAQLDARRQELEVTVSELHGRLAALHSRQVELERQREALEQQGDDLATRRQALDAQSERLIAESRALLQQVGGSEAVLAKLSEARHAIDQMEKIAR